MRHKRRPARQSAHSLLFPGVATLGCQTGRGPGRSGRGALISPGTAIGSRGAGPRPCQSCRSESVRLGCAHHAARLRRTSAASVEAPNVLRSHTHGAQRFSPPDPSQLRPALAAGPGPVSAPAAALPTVRAGAWRSALPALRLQRGPSRNPGAVGPGANRIGPGRCLGCQWSCPSPPVLVCGRGAVAIRPCRPCTAVVPVTVARRRTRNSRRDQFRWNGP